MELNEYVVGLIRTGKAMEAIDMLPEKAKLSRTEFRMLREIVTEREKGREIISSELARRLGVTRSAVSQLVAKLEAQGIIERVPSTTDRKIAYVRLSGKSLELYREMCTEANRVMERVAEELGAEKLDALFAANEEFLTVLKRVRAEIKAESKAEGKGIQ